MFIFDKCHLITSQLFFTREKNSIIIKYWFILWAIPVKTQKYSMSMTAFSHHCSLLFNFPLVTGRSVGIFFCPFRRCLCYPETLQLLSVALNSMLPLSQMQLGHFGGLWCHLSLLRSTCSWWTFTVLCWQALEQHRYSILAFSIANRALCALRGAGLYVCKAWHLFQ